MNRSTSIQTAGLDYGSNSLRLLIARVKSARVLDSLHRERIALRLATEAFEDGRFSQMTIDAVTEVSSRFARLMDINEVIRYRAVATEAFRRAENAREVIERIDDKTGIRIEILDSDEEAFLVMKAIDLSEISSSNPDLIVDLGGGSLELIDPSSKRSRKSFRYESHPLGVAAYFENFLSKRHEDEATRRELSDRAKKLGSELDSNLLEDVITSATIVLVGGQAEMLERLATTWNVWNEEESKKEGIDRIRFSRLCGRVVKEPTGNLIELGISEDRASMLPAAAALYLSIIDRVKAKSILLPCVGLIDGVLAVAQEYGTVWNAG